MNPIGNPSSRVGLGCRIPWEARLFFMLQAHWVEWVIPIRATRFEGGEVIEEDL